jgi:hypothetical protein
MPWNFQYSVDESLDWHRVTKQLDSSVFDKFPRIRQFGNERGNYAVQTSFHKFMKSAGLPAYRMLKTAVSRLLQG